LNYKRSERTTRPGQVRPSPWHVSQTIQAHFKAGQAPAKIQWQFTYPPCRTPERMPTAMPCIAFALFFLLQCYASMYVRGMFQQPQQSHASRLQSELGTQLSSLCSLGVARLIRDVAMPRNSRVRVRTREGGLETGTKDHRGDTTFYRHAADWEPDRLPRQLGPASLFANLPGDQILLPPMCRPGQTDRELVQFQRTGLMT
jgi:hypothetical protein